MAKKKAKVEPLIDVDCDLYGSGEWRVNVTVGTYEAMGWRLYETKRGAMRAAKRLSAKTGWPVVEK